MPPKSEAIGLVIIIATISLYYSRAGLTGLAGNAALVSALQQSFANQAQYVHNTFQIDQGR